MSFYVNKPFCDFLSEKSGSGGGGYDQIEVGSYGIRLFPIVLVKLAFYAPISARYLSKKMLKLCSFFKIMLITRAEGAES